MNNVRTMFFLYNVKLNNMRLYRQCSDNVKLNKKTLFEMTLYKK